MVMVSKSSSKARPPPLVEKIGQNYFLLKHILLKPSPSLNQLKRGSSHDATFLTGNFSLIILDVHVVKSSLSDIGGNPALSIGITEIGDSLSHCDGMVAFWNSIRKYTWHFLKSAQVLILLPC